MKNRFFDILKYSSLTLILAISAPILSAHAAEDKTISVQNDDAEINAAIQKARASLTIFWEKFEKPAANETGFALKVAITDANQVEHFWLTDIEKKDGKIFGVVSNQPSLVKNVQAGQKVEIPEGNISDWTYSRDGKLVGNYTLRVLLKRMPADQGKQYEDMLSKE